MIGFILWLGIIGLALGWEIICRLSHNRFLSIGRLGSFIAIRIPGRIALFAIWIFIGIHVFSRYTIPTTWP